MSARGECGGCLYGRLLARTSRAIRAAWSGNPGKPSDRRQGATNSHLGMTIESGNIFELARVNAGLGEQRLQFASAASWFPTK